MPYRGISSYGKCYGRESRETDAYAVYAQYTVTMDGWKE